MLVHVCIDHVKICLKKMICVVHFFLQSKHFIDIEEPSLMNYSQLIKTF